jgi:AraC-like DNA-binding protein
MDKQVIFTKSERFMCLDNLEQDNPFRMTNGISLDYCGMEQCEQNHRFGPFIRESFLIHIVFDGYGTYTRGGKSFRLEKGQAFLIYPEEVTVYEADKLQPWSYVWVGFHGYRSEELLYKMGFSKTNPVIVVKQLEREKECVQDILKATRLNSIDELRRTSGLFQLFALLMEDNEAYLNNTNHDYPSAVYVKYAMDYMKLHMKEKVKIDELAEFIGISRSHLTNSFKKECKMSPQEYLIQLRMEHAAYLLKDSTKPIHLIAEESGYKDSLSFSKIFKQKYKLSPTQYRETSVTLMELEK